MPIELIIAVTIRTRLKSPHFIHDIVGEISVVKSCDGVWAGSTVVLGVLDCYGDHDDDDNHVDKDDNDDDMDDNDGENDNDTKMRIMMRMMTTPSSQRSPCPLCRFQPLLDQHSCKHSTMNTLQNYK